MKEEDIRKAEAHKEYLRLVQIDVDAKFKHADISLHIPCPACGKSNSEVAVIKNPFQYLNCNACSTLYVSPRPEFKQLMSFYTDSPSTKFWIEKFFMPVAEARRASIFYPRAKFINDTLKTFENCIIGDIGSGFGLFLQELKKFWPSSRLIAIEPSTDMAEICRQSGLEVLESAVEEIDTNTIRFDLLTAFEMFEHLHDPKVFINSVHKLLNPGGILLLTTLNGLGFDIQLLGSKSNVFMPPAHLNFFNPESIRIFLQNNGFEVMEIATPGMLDWDIVEGMFKRENTDIGNFWKNFAKTGSDNAKQKLQHWISENNLSSHMRIIAKRH